MNFFTQLAALDIKNLELKFSIKDEMISVMVVPEMKNESAIPLVLSGTAEELDTEFFQIISKPLEKAKGVVSNAKEFEKSLESKTDEKKESNDLKEPATKAKTAAKQKAPAPYKHQKQLDAILAIVNEEGFEISDDNLPELADKVNMLLVMDSKNEIAISWENTIREFMKTPTVEVEAEGKSDSIENIKEEKPEAVEEAPKKEVKKEESTIEPKKETPTPPAPSPEEDEDEEDEDLFNDEDFDLDFENFID